jgi:hypothetical protein
MDADGAASPPPLPALPNITIANATRAFRPKSLALGCTHPAESAPALGRYDPVNCSVRVTGRRRRTTATAEEEREEEDDGAAAAAAATRAPMERLAFWAGMPALAQLTFEVRSAPAAAADLRLVAVVLDDFSYDIVEAR